MRHGYIKATFPKIAKYVRHPNRIYTNADPEDGERLTYSGRCFKSNSNAFGYRWYKRENGTECLIRYDDIVLWREKCDVCGGNVGSTEEYIIPKQKKGYICDMSHGNRIKMYYSAEQQKKNVCQKCAGVLEEFISTYLPVLDLDDDAFLDIKKVGSRPTDTNR